MKDFRIRFNKRIQKFQVYENLSNYMIKIHNEFMTKEECRIFINKI